MIKYCDQCPKASIEEIDGMSKIPRDNPWWNFNGRMIKHCQKMELCKDK